MPVVERPSSDTFRVGERQERVHVLVVDGSPSARAVVKRTLEAHDMDVETLDGPIGFIAAVREQQPWLVMLDTAMPTMGGTTLVQLAREHGRPGAAIVLYSDRPEEDLILATHICKADGYISKRFAGDLLAANAHKFVARAQSPNWPR
jgi:two-component system KDP operon response regulator KdpE